MFSFSRPFLGWERIAQCFQWLPTLIHSCHINIVFDHRLVLGKAQKSQIKSLNARNQGGAGIWQRWSLTICVSEKGLEREIALHCDLDSDALEPIV